MAALLYCVTTTGSVLQIALRAILHCLNDISFKSCLAENVYL